MVLQVENTFVRVTQEQINTYLFDLLKIAATEQQAHLARAGHSTLKGLDQDIDPNRAPKNFKDAMSLKDHQEWVEALNKEYRLLQRLQGPQCTRRPQANRKYTCTHGEV